MAVIIISLFVLVPLVLLLADLVRPHRSEDPLAGPPAGDRQIVSPAQRAALDVRRPGPAH